MTILLATGNPHKAEELGAILTPHKVRLPSEEGLVYDAEETGRTYLDNALIKARALWDIARRPVLADD